MLIHDWGSAYGFLLQRDRPDLISRIATLDVGGSGDKSKTNMLFSLSYQLLFSFLFALGDPLATWFMKLFYIFMPIASMGTVPRKVSELTSSMMYPYYQIFFMHLFNPKDEYLKQMKGGGGLHEVDGSKCPVFFAYGAGKPIMFHSDKWIESLETQKNCKAISMECGHWIMTDKPKELNEELITWLQET